MFFSSASLSSSSLASLEFSSGQVYSLTSFLSFFVSPLFSLFVNLKTSICQLSILRRSIFSKKSLNLQVFYGNAAISTRHTNAISLVLKASRSESLIILMADFKNYSVFSIPNLYYKMDDDNTLPDYICATPNSFGKVRHKFSVSSK